MIYFLIPITFHEKRLDDKDDGCFPSFRLSVLSFADVQMTTRRFPVDATRVSHFLRSSVRDQPPSRSSSQLFAKELEASRAPGTHLPQCVSRVFTSLNTKKLIIASLVLQAREGREP